ncbi:DUF389 domain-containing protein [Streptomyces collinus]|uniref:DUF389 domain-containing protein n=1 Tax=Streptomyces collinus TaxID=42684 RepID=UPI0033DDEB71
MDLIAALATGLVGAVTLARRDVAAMLPGVAIAISLVPPLAVAGLCRRKLSRWPALFVSNLVALVVAGMAVFAPLGHTAEADKAAGRPAGRSSAAMALLFVIVLVPLTANTVATLLLNAWTGRTKDAAQQWLADEPDASVTSVCEFPDDVHPRSYPGRPSTSAVPARPARRTDSGQYPPRGGCLAGAAHRRRRGWRPSAASASCPGELPQRLPARRSGGSHRVSRMNGPETGVSGRRLQSVSRRAVRREHPGIHGWRSPTA